MKQWSTLKKLIWLRAMSAVKEYSGAVVTFFANAVKPLKALITNLPPIQDLHGYDNPWPAGGGVSKCPSFANGTHTMTNGLTVTIQDGEITINGTASGSGYYEEAIESTVMPADAYVSFNNPVGTYNMAYVFINGNAQIASPSTAPANATKQPTGLSGATVNKLRIFCNAATYDNFKMSPIVHDGSTPQAWQPYANICPISGRTGLNVYRTGKNLIDYSAFQRYTNWSDSIATYGDFSTNSSNKGYLLPIVSGVEYTISLGISSSSYPNYCYLCRANGNNVSQRVQPFTTSSFNTSSITFMAESGWIYYVRIGSSWSEGMFDGQMEKISYAQIELGSTATAYESYQGTTYPVTWQTEAGTVYGGTLDVVSGALTVDRAMVDLGAQTWHTATAVGHTRFWATITGIAQIPLPNIVAPMLCSNYPTKTANQTYAGTTGVSLQHNSANIYIYDPQKEELSVSDFKTAMNGVQLVYELATPVTYQLTPQEVKSLVGQNVVWSDAGEVTVRV